MIRAFLMRLLSKPLEFEKPATNWQALRDGIRKLRENSEQQLKDQAVAAIARRQA